MKRSVYRLSYFQHPKRSHRRALGLFLLALPLGGIAFQLPGVQAQPTPPIPAKKSLKPLSAEQKAAITRVWGISRQEEMCKSLIDLKVENATLEDVTARVKASLPGRAVPIAVRGARPLRVGFDLKDTPTGDVLTHVAGLAGCKVFLLGNGLLIAPPTQLSEAELQEIKQQQAGEWMESVASGGSGWSNQRVAHSLFAKSIAQEITGSDATPFAATVVKTTFSNFSPDAQKMLQQMVNWSTEDSRRRTPSWPSLALSASSPVVVDTSDPLGIQINFPRNDSDPGAVSIAMKISPQ